MDIQSRHWVKGRLAGTAIMAGVAGLLGAVAPYAGQHGLGITGSHSRVALAACLLTAAIVGRLAVRLRRSAHVSAQLSQQQSALRQVATLVARSAPPSTVFEAVARETGLLCGADLACLARFEAYGGMRGVATWSRRGRPDPSPVGARSALEGRGAARQVRPTCGPVRIEDVEDTTAAIARKARAPGMRSSVGRPIVVDGEAWGAIVVSKESDGPFPADTESQMAAFADLAAIAVENARTHAELTASRARVVTAADGARRRIERDLHDGVQQRLVSLLLLLQHAQLTVPPDLAELRARLRDVAAGVTGAFDELREVARGIHPAVLAHGGLGPALRALARRSALPVDVEVRLRGRLPERVEVSAYYVVSEALTNAAKHAEASTVTVTVDTDSGVLRVRVQDDGVGGAAFAAGTGLVGLKDRVEALGGRMVLDSPRTAGTTLSAELPLGPSGRTGRDQTAAALRRH
ncbi:GAF domain-containing sensor histidine kinase [Streptomyces barringtoniae]|uniref:GAF domain-containing sensor histidine kinase n=1 Tax=Streptomyces barringtoniae TaxID=2892029 RepID=UPI001E4F7F29|nr:GAF domain-containing protein [Streptomyces barringtoniae]MCC5480542.1 histidine kinase [Streptomyces barringtoniae]